MAISAGLKELDELEESEDLFRESDTEDDSQSLDDIESELKQRADSTAKLISYSFRFSKRV